MGEMAEQNIWDSEMNDWEHAEVVAADSIAGIPWGEADAWYVHTKTENRDES